MAWEIIRIRYRDKGLSDNSQEQIAWDRLGTSCEAASRIFLEQLAVRLEEHHIIGAEFLDLSDMDGRNIAPGTPVENINVMVEAAEEYGPYR